MHLPYLRRQGTGISLEIVTEADRIPATENVVNARVRLARLTGEAAEVRDDRRILVEQVRDAAENLPTGAARPLPAEGQPCVGIDDRVDVVVADRHALDVACVEEPGADVADLQERRQRALAVSEVRRELDLREFLRADVACIVDFRGA